MAEAVGFEPTNEFPRRWFSRPVPSTTRPRFRQTGLILPLAILKDYMADFRNKVWRSLFLKVPNRYNKQSGAEHRMFLG